MEFNDIQPKSSVEIVGRTASDIDEGLRSYMIKVFNYMGLGLCITALCSYWFYAADLWKMFYNLQTGGMSGLGWIVTFAPLIMIFAFSAVIRKGSLFATQAMFWAFSAVMGLSLSSIFVAYTTDSIVRVFLISAATFGAMSIFGYTTKRDLTKIGSFMYMGVWGLVIASIVNLFLHSTALMYTISYIAVVAFTVLTAYDVQSIKNLYYISKNNSVFAAKAAVSGALNLYIDLINIFISLLNIMGNRR
ncbi:MAG: Bax inhibitor-1/YccA family protein [Alphaproteobacteria bacterium]|nr:Bax inhibitor-1/YccA family protein [Alphaproteobacteria bacterium]